MDLLIIALGLYLSWGLIRILMYFANRGKPGKGGNLPPGPRRLPIIGNLLDLGSQPHRSLAKLASIHGPLMSLKLGSITTVVVSSAPEARGILQTQDATFCNRFLPDCSTALRHHELGLPWIPVSPLWRNLRRICNTNLFAPGNLESNHNLRHQKLECFLTQVGKCSEIGNSVDIGQAGFTTSLNLLGSTIFSMDLAETTFESGKEFKELVSQVLVQAGKPNLADFFPVLKRFDPQGVRRRMDRYMGKLHDIFYKIINDRAKSREAIGFIRNNDMLDTLLDLCEDEKEGMDVLQINHLLKDLFVAGTDTTSITLEWAMTELLRNPEKLSKAQEELKQVLGRGIPVKESDVARLPYLRAVVKENFRMHPTVPLLIPRRAAATVQVSGYTVPEGAKILINVWAIGRDPASWRNPDEFMPERFLGQDIDVKGQDFELLPFGGGRRICPGLPLAMSMLHTMLGSLLNCFDWKLEDGFSPGTMDMRERFGMTLQKAEPLRAVPVPLPVKRNIQ